MAVSLCERCRRPGEPYTYRGRRFSGLVACEGQRLCRRCSEHYLYEKRREPVGPAGVPASEYVTPQLP